MYKAIVATEAPLTPLELRRDLENAGIEIIEENTDATVLVQAVVRHTPDIVIAASASPSSLLFDAARMLGTLAPCPFILFTADSDVAKIQRASDSGIHAYVVDGYAKHRVISVIQVARARFRHEQTLKDEFTGLSLRYEERKLIDRAKGVLMRSRGVTEDEAFELLRNLAMRSRQRMGVVALSVIDMSKAGEAVNRAGQLRMLSQRIVRCYAQCLTGLDAVEAQQSMSDSVARVETNIVLLRKLISTKGYGELVERVYVGWQEMMLICAQQPHISRIDALDVKADRMLGDAETLTEFLESSGLVSSLHVINVAGRQRMLSQRIAKLCVLLSLQPSGERLTQLRELTTAFQTALDYLAGVPLSSSTIRPALQAATMEWQRLHHTLGSLHEATSLEGIMDASEKLLNAMEELTHQYEQAMQMLIGDRIGKIRLHG